MIKGSAVWVRLVLRSVAVIQLKVLSITFEHECNQCFMTIPVHVIKFLSVTLSHNRLAFLIIQAFYPSSYLCFYVSYIY